MRNATRLFIIFFVIVSLVFVPTMAMAAAGTAAGTAAGRAGFFGISNQTLIIGGVLFVALFAFAAAELLTTTTHH